MELEAEDLFEPDAPGLTDEQRAEFDEEIAMAAEGRWEELGLDPPEAPVGSGVAEFLRAP